MESKLRNRNEFPKRMPVGVDDFAKMRREYYFVDKTGFLEDFIENHAEVTLFTRPRRFGKTLTLSMMYYFFSLQQKTESAELFQGLEIEKNLEKYSSLRGTYPVVFFSLKDCKYDTWAMCYEGIKDKIAEIYDSFHGLEESEKLTARERDLFLQILSGTASEGKYMQSLQLLLRLLEKQYGRKAILLLDEYDVPIQQSWEHGYYKECISFMRNFLSAALKTNPSLEFAALTGVLRIAKESIFSSLNNLFVDSVLQGNYPDAFGFTEQEVAALAAELGAEAKLMEIRAWYDGYRFGGHEIYNPWSVINYFFYQQKPGAYWVNTSGNSIVAELLHRTDAEQQRRLLELLQGNDVVVNLREGVIYPDIYTDQDALYTMLVITGYLKIVQERFTLNGYLCSLAIPNLEIRSIYSYEVMDKLRGGVGISDLMILMENLLNGQTQAFSEGLQRYLAELVSVYDAANKESFYHGFLLGMTALLVPTYQVKSNRESGYGRFDLAIFPKKRGDTGVILEFKIAEKAEMLESKAAEALQQIQQMDYVSEFRELGAEKVLRYGIAFCGKRMVLKEGT